MPHPRVCTGRHQLALALPWAGLLAVWTTLAWAMHVGVTDDEPTSYGDPLSTQLLVRDTPPEVVFGSPIEDGQLAPRSFPQTSRVLTITVDGPGGSHDVYCATTPDRAPFDAVSVRPDQTMDVFRQLCSPQPSAS
jgi:hypothetical protein